MGDELEQFINRNRSEFDTDKPSSGVWAKIQSKIQSRGMFERWWKIAAVLFFVSTSYLLLDKHLTQNAVHTEPLAELAEFAQAENYYIRLIAEKKAEIAKFDRELMKEEFLQEIDRLDQLYNELKKTYKQQNSTDLLVDAMISNLQLRIDILNQQIRILKKLNETQNESDSNIEI